MPWWLSSIGAVVAAVSTFVIAWSALKPRQRLFATRFFSRWAQRAAIAFAILYFVWVNVSFVIKDGPIGRVELLILLLANAEAFALILVHLFVRAANLYLNKRNECREKMYEQTAALEVKAASSSTLNRGHLTSAKPMS